MVPQVEERSRITAKGQTTVPIAVRLALCVDVVVKSPLSWVMTVSGHSGWDTKR